MILKNLLKTKKVIAFLFMCHSCLVFAQITENFEGESLSSVWTGDRTCFVITPDHQLQLKAPDDATQSYLSASSAVIADAEWDFTLRMDFNPSASNYFRFYLCSDKSDLGGSLQGYFLQIGSTNDQILLYSQSGTTTKKIGESENKRVDVDTVRLQVRVTKDKSGNWIVFSKKPDETDFVKEFSCVDAAFEKSAYTGFRCNFTKTRKEHFRIDSIIISGDTIRKETLPAMWQGEDTCYVMTADGKIQLKAPKDKGKSYLSTPSAAISDAEWNLSIQMNFNPSGSNYARFYLVSDSPTLIDSLDGYFLQIGNNSDQILLYQQSGMTIRKLCESEAGRVNTDTVQIDLKVERDDKGNWTVFSKNPNETAYMKEFSCVDSTLMQSFYAGIYANFSATRNEQFFFYNFSVTGDSYEDLTKPEIVSYQVTGNILKLYFSEPIEKDKISFGFYPELTYQSAWDLKGSALTITFDEALARGRKYSLRMEHYQDLAGNGKEDEEIFFGIAEKVEPGDLLLNEVLFNPYSNGTDFVEILNSGNKIIQLSELNLATRRSDLSLYSSKPLAAKLIFPGEYVVICADKNAVCNFYRCPDENVFVVLPSLPVYGNEKGCVVLTRKDSVVIDEFNYLASMHSEFIRDKQGVSLERESPESNDWHSASEVAGFATPGYTNSQSASTTTSGTIVRLENDVCFPWAGEEGYASLRYRFKQAGYICNIRIYNVSGQPVRTLADNLLLSVEGVISWDGKDDLGRIVPVSPYILLFEAFHPDGDIFRKSFVNVVSK